MNHFGPYTERYAELIEARLAIKHGEIDKAKNMLNGISGIFGKAWKSATSDIVVKK